MSQIIDSNSVQSQFLSLTKTKDKLRNNATAADLERKKEESIISNLRSTESNLNEKIRVANAQLGIHTQKLQLFRNEKSRLTKLITDDRNSKELLTEKQVKLESEAKKRKMHFIKDMDSYNDELDVALRQYDANIMMTSITPKTCAFLEKFLENKVQNDIKDQEQWRSVIEEINVSMRPLQEIYSQYNKEMETKKSLEEKAEGLRENVLGMRGDNCEYIGEIELDRLERIWEGHSNDGVHSGIEENAGVINHPVERTSNNMELFYGDE